MGSGSPSGPKSGVGVSVGGARVGMGACVGVAGRVLAGKAKVGAAVGTTNVGRSTVGIAITMVAAGGVATRVGRAK